MSTSVSSIDAAHLELRDKIQSLSDLLESRILSAHTMMKIHELKVILGLELEQMDFNAKFARLIR